jgi:signal transduction histidine kinase/CheY-like chemotaxis protein
MRASEVLQTNRETVQSELARRAARHNLVSAFFSFLGYGSHALFLIGTVPNGVLLAWLALVVAGAVAHGMFGAALRRAHDQPGRREKLLLALMLSLLMWGGVWGSMVLLPGVTASPIFLALILVCVAGTAVASIHPLHFHSGSLAAFTAGMLVPTALLPALGNDVPVSLSVIAVGFWGMCQLYGWMTRKIVLDAIAAELNLRIAKDAAEAANRSKNVFLSSMSHELRTPLNAILGYTQLLARQEDLTEQRRRQLGIMLASSNHLLGLIGDILDLSKIEAQKMDIVEAPFQLPQLLEQVVEISRPRARKKQLVLVFEQDSPLPQWVRGDERRVRQVLLNLLTNAIKFTRQGSVTLRVAYDAKGGSALRCDVADTGVGIPKDKLDAIFEPFTQLTPDAQGREGAGLGLSITRRLASLMGGSITVESRVGSGSVFRFSVPLPTEAVGQTAAEPEWRSISGYRGERKRILVVDDNPVNAGLLVDLLEPLGFDVTTAASGREAIKQAMALRPDLVLLDLVMPDMDGLEAAQELRRHADLSRTLIVGVSATVTDSERKKLFSEACDAFLGKPVQIGELLQIIERLLSLEWEQACAGETAKPESPAAALAPAMLAALTPELRQELADAALTLDGERIAALIQRIETADGGLARILSSLLSHFDYQSILNAVNAAGLNEGERDHG